MLGLFIFLEVFWFYQVHSREFPRSLLWALGGLVGFLAMEYILFCLSQIIYIYLIGDMMVSDDAKQAILQACLLMNGYEEAHYHM